MYGYPWSQPQIPMGYRQPMVRTLPPMGYGYPQLPQYGGLPMYQPPSFPGYYPSQPPMQYSYQPPMLSSYQSRVNYMPPVPPQPQPSLIMQSPNKNFMKSPVKGTIDSQRTQPFIPMSPPRGPQFAPPQKYPPGVHFPGHQQQAPGPQVRAPPQESIKQQPAKQKASQPQSQAQKKNPQDELEKRFNDAIERTKKIVDNFQKQRPSENDRNSQNERNPQVEEEEHQPENEEGLEDLALQYEDGFIYRGQGIPESTRQGFGILTDNDGLEVYVGYWQNNLYHGAGKLQNLQREPFDGSIDWNDFMSIENAWEKYEGDFHEGHMHGRGNLQFTNGEWFEGEFQNGMVHGHGEFHSKSGDVVKGVWENGQFVQLQE